MGTWADDEGAYTLSTQLVELLGEKRMMDTQLASSYSIKHARSINKVLSEISGGSDAMTLLQFLQASPQCFHVMGNVVTVVGEPPNPLGASDGLKYADVSRGIQTIFKETKKEMPIKELERVFESKFSCTIESVTEMSTEEYLQKKKNIFTFDENTGNVYLSDALLSGPPIPDPSVPRDEKFVVDEFVRLVEDGGPICYISTLCGKFIQRNGIAVTSIIGSRPLDLFKRHPEKFQIVGGGNVTLKKFGEHQAVKDLVNQQGQSKAARVSKVAEDNSKFPVPDVITELEIVEEFRRLIMADGTKTVYISSLCGRFLQRYKQPVTAIIDERPADFLRRYGDIFVMTGGGNVGLREVLGPDVESVPAAPRDPKKLEKKEEEPASKDMVRRLMMTDHIYNEVHACIAHWDLYHQTVNETKKLCEVLEQNAFLAVEDVVLGGAGGKGVVTKGALESQVVLFVRQLPTMDHAKWMPHIIETLQAVLEINMKEASQAKIEDGVLTLKLRKNVKVTLAVSPVYKSRETLLECIRNSPPAQRAGFQWSFVREHVDFIGSQSQESKVVIRLITWWALQQPWSSEFTRPSAYLLELVCVHASEQLKAQQPDITDMIDFIFEIFANFDTIKVLWADTGAAHYALKDIWKPLLSHEPLFMDPVNPYCNLVDANRFDSHELVKFASVKNKLEPFQKEAAMLPFVKASFELPPE